MALSKPQFLEALGALTGLPKTDNVKLVHAYTQVVVDALARDGEVTLPDLVKILLKDKAATVDHPKRNPFTGVTVIVKAKPATKKILAKATGTLKRAVIKPAA